MTLKLQNKALHKQIALLVSAIVERNPIRHFVRMYVCMSMCPQFLTIKDFNDDVMLASALCKDDISLM